MSRASAWIASIAILRVSRARAISGPGSEFLAAWNTTAARMKSPIATITAAHICHREPQRRDQARERKEAEPARKKLQPDFTDQGICLLKVVKVPNKILHHVMAPFLVRADVLSIFPPQRRQSHARRDVPTRSSRLLQRTR